MSTRRPYMQHRIGELEALFDHSRNDMRVLKALEGELRYRQVPKAVSLLADVQEALYAAKTLAPAKGAVVSEPGAVSPVEVHRVETLPIPRSSTRASTNQEPSSPGLLSLEQDWGVGLPGEDAPAVGPSIDAPIANVDSSKPVTLETAYKLLKALPTSPWEKVELARQQLVLQAHPGLLMKMSEEKRRGVLAQSLLANQAYAMLAGARVLQ